jgi:type I restriction enzyme S subunit
MSRESKESLSLDMIGIYPDHWKEMTLSDICTQVTDGTHDSPKEVIDGYPLVTGKAIKNRRIDFSIPYNISEEDHLKVISRSKAARNDILFANIGNSIGDLVRVQSDLDFSIKNVALFKPDQRIVNPRFVEYYLFSTQVQEFIKNTTKGSAQPFIGLATLRGFPISVPPKCEQDYIVKLLGDLDDKIEINRQINQTLEFMAQAIFQSWFVDFDPVKAKIAAREQWQILTDEQRTEWLNELLNTQGSLKTCLLDLTAKAGLSDDEILQLDNSLNLISCRGHGPEGSESLDIGLNNLRKEWQSKIAGPALQSASETLYLNIAAMTAISSRNETSLIDMPADEFAQLYKTASLFPERLVESELGEIPEGWRLDELRKIAHFSTERIDLSELTLENYVSTENMLEHKKGITTASSLPTVKTVPKFEPGQILISNIRPYFMKIWLASFVGGRSNDVLGINSKEPESIQYLYNLLYQDRFFNFMMTTSKGAKMPRGDKEAIMSWLCVQPTFEIKNAYSEIVEKFVGIVVNNKKENKYLENARVILLPKLLSGEIDVSVLTALSDIVPAAMDV